MAGTGPQVATVLFGSLCSAGARTPKFGPLLVTTFHGEVLLRRGHEGRLVRLVCGLDRRVKLWVRPVISRVGAVAGLPSNGRYAVMSATATRLRRRPWAW
jgi:hypothetical protein